MSWSSHDRRRAALLAIGPAGLGMTAPATAQTVPRLEVETAVLLSENPLLIPGPDRGAAQLDMTVRPGIAVTTAAGTTFDLAAVVTQRTYTRRYGDILIGRVEATAMHRNSEFLTVGGAASYARDSAIDLLTSSVEAAADPTSLRNTAAARAYAEYRPSAYTTIIPQITVERSSFTRSAVLGDTRLITTEVAVRRRLSERRTLGIRAGWLMSDGSRVSSFATQVGYVTIDQQLTAGWRLTAELGAERSGARTEMAGMVPVRQSARILPGGRVSLCRNEPAPAICVGGTLSSEVSALGGLQRRAVFDASYDQRLGERTMLRATAEYQRTTAQDALFAPFDAVRAVAVVERTLGRRIVAAGTLQYLRRRLADGDRIGAAYLGLRLSYTPGLR